MDGKHESDSRNIHISNLIRCEYNENDTAFTKYLLSLIDREDYKLLRSLLPLSIYNKIEALLNEECYEKQHLNVFTNKKSDKDAASVAKDRCTEDKKHRNCENNKRDMNEKDDVGSSPLSYDKPSSACVSNSINDGKPTASSSGLNFSSDTEIIVNVDVPDTLLPQKFPTIEQCSNNLAFLSKVSTSEEDEETVDDKIELIVSTLKNNQVLIVQGNTGCGKTTKIPRYLLSHYRNIVCTQPRKIAAINVARKVALDLNVKLGDLVGYAVRFDDVSSANTRLKFVTDGVLLREIYSDKSFLKYDVIVVDEAHERTLNIDIVLGYCKKIIEQRKDMRIVIMSATLNVDKFIAFFNCPMIEIKHKVYPLENFYLRHEPNDNPFLETLRTVVQIHETAEAGDIIVFLTGQEEIENGYNILNDRLKNAEVLKLYSSMTPEQQDLVFCNYKNRKIILSTNIAETSVTIEDVKFVVDCGLVKQKRFCSETGVDILEVVEVSKAQAKQRSGRSGRTAPGKCFRVYTKEVYKNFEENKAPEILRTNLASLVLLLKSIGIDDLYSFNFIDTPKKSSIFQALQFLYYLKAVDFNGNITKLGRRMACIPLNPELSVSLITASKLGCLEEVAIISAMLSVYPVWIELDSRSNKHALISNAKLAYKHEKGDYFSLLKIYKDWEEARFSYKFAKQKFIKYKALEQAKKIKTQLCSMFEYSSSNKEDVIAEAFCSGYFMNVAKYTSSGYVSVFNNTQCYLHPSSCLYGKYHKYLLYYSLVRTRKEFLNLCMVITPEMLLKASNNLYLRKG